MKNKHQLKSIVFSICCLLIVAFATLMQIHSDHIIYKEQTAKLAELHNEIEILKQKGFAPVKAENISQELSTIVIPNKSNKPQMLLLVFCVITLSIFMWQIIATRIHQQKRTKKSTHTQKARFS
jgi:hypothetical protein